ncbi:hypothetical protein GOODEAATRI_031163 [Goodea atripinnis]|uniref:Phosphatidylinositol-specific phospholipase C X domain-containing protein n=1 Tax=Goodea atripinnis TaxID=208336 RepID=A0ABV0NPN0_9TELE
MSRTVTAASLTMFCFTWIHAYLSRADQNHDDKMSYEEVQTLLQMINIDLSDQYARSLFQVDQLSPSGLLTVHSQRNQFMTPNGFTMYMLSKENCVFNPEHLRVYQDMKHPLSHYFISSSHNTYLTKDQLTGASSTETYIRDNEPSLAKLIVNFFSFVNILSCLHSKLQHEAKQSINEVVTF